MASTLNVFRTGIFEDGEPSVQVVMDLTKDSQASLKDFVDNLPLPQGDNAIYEIPTACFFLYQVEKDPNGLLAKLTNKHILHLNKLPQVTGWKVGKKPGSREILVTIEGKTKPKTRTVNVWYVKPSIEWEGCTLKRVTAKTACAIDEGVTIP